MNTAKRIAAFTVLACIVVIMLLPTTSRAHLGEEGGGYEALVPISQPPMPAPPAQMNMTQSTRVYFYFFGAAVGITGLVVVYFFRKKRW